LANLGSTLKQDRQFPPVFFIIFVFKLGIGCDAVLWQEASEGKIPSDSLGFPSRFGDQIYFCKVKDQVSQSLNIFNFKNSSLKQERLENYP
jgi:hypothetical protein